MPMIGLMGNTLSVMFDTPSPLPLAASLTHWSPGDTFSPAAAWYTKLDPIGGEGALFNNQYGFMTMSSAPSGKAFGIRLLSASAELQSWNYGNGQNRFDEIFQEPGDQVLWNGSMWHNYFTLPAGTAAGVYSATFEIFIADATFTDGTGYADYTPGALNAAQDMNYNTVSFTYEWQVVPEPSSALLVLAALGGVLVFRRSFRRSESVGT